MCVYIFVSAANNFIAINEGKCVIYGIGVEVVVKCNCVKGVLNFILNFFWMVG